MENYKHLLLAGAMISSIAHAKNATNLGQYITGNYVDQDGKTLLHKLGEHSCGKKFVLKFDAFNLFENELPAEMPKLKDHLDTFLFTYKFSPDLAALIVVAQVAKFANHKDNNGNTALDLAKKSREEAIERGDVPSDRNGLLINILEGFEPQNEELVELIESAVN